MRPASGTGPGSPKDDAYHAAPASVPTASSSSSAATIEMEGGRPTPGLFSVVTPRIYVTGAVGRGTRTPAHSTLHDVL